MAIFKRGNIYWYEFTYQGVRHRVSSGSSNKRVCTDALAAKRLELAENRNGLKPVVKPKRCSVALNECIELNKAHWAPKTQELHRNSLQHLEPFFGKMLLSQVTADDIARYQGKRQDAGASNRTINIEIGLLRLALKRARLWASLTDDVKMLKENKDIGRALSQDEQTRLLAACKASASRSLHTAVLVSLHTGLRNRELRLLRWRQIDLLAATVQVGKSKTEGGSGRVIPLSQAALQVLQEWRAQFPTAQTAHYVFPSERYHLQGSPGVYGGKVEVYSTDPEKPVRSFASAWRTAKKIAGVSCRWHDMRHSALSAIAEGGAMDATLMAIAGHMSVKMKELYSHTRTAAKRQAVSVFDLPLPESTTVN